MARLTTTRLGARMYRVDPPITDKWEFGEDFPEAFELDGKVFERAIRTQPYQDVIVQYREAVPRDSAHLLVMNNGMWVIDHVDEYNPDRGFPFRHFVVDHPKGKGTLVAGAGLLGLAGAALCGVAERGKQSDKGS